MELNWNFNLHRKLPFASCCYYWWNPAKLQHFFFLWHCKMKLLFSFSTFFGNEWVMVSLFSYHLPLAIEKNLNWQGILEVTSHHFQPEIILFGALDIWGLNSSLFCLTPCPLFLLRYCHGWQCDTQPVWKCLSASLWQAFRNYHI